MKYRLKKDKDPQGQSGWVISSQEGKNKRWKFYEGYYDFSEAMKEYNRILHSQCPIQKEREEMFSFLQKEAIELKAKLNIVLNDLNRVERGELPSDSYETKEAS